MKWFTNVFNKKKHRTQTPFSKEIDEMVRRKIEQDNKLLQSKKDEFDSNFNKYIENIKQEIVNAKVSGDKKIEITISNHRLFGKTWIDPDIGWYAATIFVDFLNNAVGEEVAKKKRDVYDIVFIKINVDKI